MGKVRRKHLDLDEELVSWYEENYPNASLPWLVNMLLRAFVDTHGLTTPITNAQDAAQIVKDNIDEGVL